jgi:hypothetical protein
LTEKNYDKIETKSVVGYKTSPLQFPFGIGNSAGTGVRLNECISIPFPVRLELTAPWMTAKAVTVGLVRGTYSNVIWFYTYIFMMCFTGYFTTFVFFFSDHTE